MKYLSIFLLVLFACSANNESNTNDTKEEKFGCKLLSETKQNNILWDFDLNKPSFSTKINKARVWVDKYGISVYFSKLYAKSYTFEVNSSCYDDLYNYLKRRYTGYIETENERLKEKYLEEVVVKEYR